MGRGTDILQGGNRTFSSSFGEGIIILLKSGGLALVGLDGWGMAGGWGR
jgi:hypothetical protein